jgi:hypothetical protein
MGVDAISRLYNRVTGFGKRELAKAVFEFRFRWRKVVICAKVLPFQGNTGGYNVVKRGDPGSNQVGSITSVVDMSPKTVPIYLTGG